MEQNIITFNGDNSKLFTRVPSGSVNAKMTLIVPETHYAILIKDGQMLQTLSSGKYQIGKFIDPKEDEGALLEVLFMSKTAKLKLRWGTAQKLLMFDETKNQNYRAGFSGDFEVQIGDPRKCYLYLVGASNDLTADALQERLQSNVVSVMETSVVEYIKENKIPFSQIAVFKKEMSQRVLKNLSHKLQSEYGISVFSFQIANIIIDESDLQKLENPNTASRKSTCKKCGVELLPNAKFCSNCGNKVNANSVCPKCGIENMEGAQFCLNCGERL